MGKAEKGTPKDIAKRIKSKGLQKLKFYCQMCEKQCRDANGFKCHMTSESHLRQMKIFSENAGGIMDRYSREFETSYLQTLRQRHTTKRVNANNVYQELIADKQHIHMNSTKWATLSDFVMYLGKTGRCVVDETDRGWYVQYVQNDASILARKRAQEQRAEAERAAESAQAERMATQRIEAAKALDRAGGTVLLEATKIERTSNEDNTVSVAFKTNTTNGSSNSKKKKKATNGNAAGFFDDDDEEEEDIAPLSKPNLPLPELPPSSASNNSVAYNKRPAQPKEEDPEKNASKKRQRKEEDDDDDKKNRKDPSSTITNSSKRQDDDDKDDDNKSREEEPWLKRDIVVRIITKKLANGKYFRRKAVVDHVLKEDKFSAEVEVLDSEDSSAVDRDDDNNKRDGGGGGGDILRLDQNDLETVVPKEGKKVRVLKGKYRGKKAKVVSLDKKKYRATLKLVDDGTVLTKMDFEDFSQLAVPPA